jgi:hypothetical protein
MFASRHRTRHGPSSCADSRCRLSNRRHRIPSDSRIRRLGDNCLGLSSCLGTAASCSRGQTSRESTRTAHPACSCRDTWPGRRGSHSCIRWRRLGRRTPVRPSQPRTRSGRAPRTLRGLSSASLRSSPSGCTPRHSDRRYTRKCTVPCKRRDPSSCPRIPASRTLDRTSRGRTRSGPTRGIDPAARCILQGSSGSSSRVPSSRGRIRTRRPCNRRGPNTRPVRQDSARARMRRLTIVPRAAAAEPCRSSPRRVFRGRAASSRSSSLASSRRERPVAGRPRRILSSREAECRIGSGRERRTRRDPSSCVHRRPHRTGRRTSRRSTRICPVTRTRRAGSHPDTAVSRIPPRRSPAHRRTRRRLRRWRCTLRGWSS